MKNRVGLLIIVTATIVAFITLCSGCNNKDKNNSLLNKNTEKYFQRYLAQGYVGERENGSKVYLIEKHESGSRYLIIKKDGSYKQALVFGEVPEKKILASSQDKCLEIYKDPNYITEGRNLSDLIEKMGDDDGSDCSRMLMLF